MKTRTITKMIAGEELVTKAFAVDVPESIDIGKLSAKALAALDIVRKSRPAQEPAPRRKSNRGSILGGRDSIFG